MRKNEERRRPDFHRKRGEKVKLYAGIICRNVICVNRAYEKKKPLPFCEDANDGCKGDGELESKYNVGKGDSRLSIKCVESICTE